MPEEPASHAESGREDAIAIIHAALVSAMNMLATTYPCGEGQKRTLSPNILLQRPPRLMVRDLYQHAKIPRFVRSRIINFNPGKRIREQLL